MTKEELNTFEHQLQESGYKKITSCKCTENDDYEYYKAFYFDDKNEDDELQLKYQIFFEFWDFEKYQKNAGYSVSVSILPESCRNYVGRRDLKLSVDWSNNLDKVEKTAEMFFDFITKVDEM